VLGSGGFGDVVVEARKGEPYGAIRGYRYERDADGNILVEDGYPLRENNLSVLGNIQPSWTGGWANQFSFGNFSLNTLFDVKHDTGGMVDIEFVVQYVVLAHAHAHPQLTRNAGNIALLALAGELGLVPAELAGSVADAYREYRRSQHQVRLTGAAQARVDPKPQAARRQAVTALWTQVFGEPWAQ